MRPFVTSLTAILTHTNDDGQLNYIEVGSMCRIYIVPSLADAEERGAEHARERWPASRGWRYHSATPSELTREQARQLLDAFPDLDDLDHPPEMVM